MFMVTLMISILVFILLLTLLMLVFSKVLRRKSSSTIFFVGSALMIAFGIYLSVSRHLIGLVFLVIAILWVWRGVKLRGTK